MGTLAPESSMPLTPFTVARARTPHWRHTAFGIPKQTSIVTSNVPRLFTRTRTLATTAQPVVTSLLTRDPRGETPAQRSTNFEAVADSDRAGVCVISDATCDGR
jgi:hypothetical protein